MERGTQVEENPISGIGLDTIHNLPDELLSHILTFLPVSSAVKTSILSTRWRYLFTLMLCLSLDDAPCLLGHCTTRRFKEFVDKVLESNQISPIKRFSLVCRHQGSHDYDNSDLHRWVSTVLQKGVQELHYTVYTVPDSLFLSVSACRLSKLKILHLEGITFMDFTSMARLFSGCRLLESLTLKCCKCDTVIDRYASIHHRSGILEGLRFLTIEQCSFLYGTFEIDAPNLKYLSFHFNFGVKIASTSWGNSCSFVKAELSFDNTDNGDSVEYDRELLRAAAYKTTTVCFDMDSLQLLLTPGGDDKLIPDFRNLLRLELGNCPYDSWRYLTSLLDGSPKLETLIFTAGFGCWECSLSHIRFKNRRLPFSCHAQVIEVRDFCGHRNPLLFMGHLLGNASALKRLIVFTIRKLNLEEERKFSNDLWMIPKASIDCSVEINNVV